MYVEINIYLIVIVEVKVLILIKCRKYFSEVADLICWYEKTYLQMCGGLPN